MRPPQLPAVSVIPDQVWLDGGLDLIAPPGLAKPGTCRFALNYELEFGGGYRRIGGFERVDGRPAPSNAEYIVMQVEASTITLGMTVTGSVSDAEGKVVWISPDTTLIGLTRLLDGYVFEDGEDLLVAASIVAVVADSSPSIDSFIDNDVAHAAANEYRNFIQKPPGQYQIRGVAILNSQLFCWRDDGAAMKIYKATASGWTLVPLKKRISFTAGTTEYLDGGTLTQGAVSAVIKRVVTTAGSWSGGTAEGYLVINDPVGGSFTGGAAAGTGACTLAGAETPIQLLAAGRVATVAHNFYGAAGTERLYGCDGVNKEFEFDGETLVPLETGVGTVRAKYVCVFKEHLFFAFNSSMQHSGVGDPYKWTPVFGAAELAVGDIITNFVTVAGSEANAALMVTARDSIHVLYGSSSADWQLTPLATEAGAQAFSAQQMGVPLMFDRDGFIQVSPTQSYGNFSYDSESRSIDPLVRNSTVMCSVLVKNKSRYRCFFTDGSFVSGTPIKGGIGWMPCDYGRVITCVVGGEIAGQYRVFMGDEDGWVLEADVGRSFDGGEVESGLRLSSLNQKSPVSEKQYRYAEILMEPESAFQLAFGAEYSDAAADDAQLTATDMVDFKKQYGSGLFWDFNAWDRAYWDGAAVNRARYDIGGFGRSISLLFSGVSDRELPHTLKVATVLYTQRRLAR